MISAKTATWGSLDLGGNWCEFATIPSAFSNLHQMATGEIALVEMNFENGNWEGTSSIQRYPALSNGTYKIENQEITFSNRCFWTADFDWTLILSGTYVPGRSQNRTLF